MTLIIKFQGDIDSLGCLSFTDYDPPQDTDSYVPMIENDTDNLFAAKVGSQFAGNHRCISKKYSVNLH